MGVRRMFTLAVDEEGSPVEGGVCLQWQWMKKGVRLREGPVTFECPVTQ